MRCGTRSPATSWMPAGGRVGGRRLLGPSPPARPRASVLPRPSGVPPPVAGGRPPRPGPPGEVPGCDGIAETRKGTTGLCAACAHYMARTGTSEIPDMCAKAFTIGVGRCLAGCPRPWESRRRPLCAAHDHQQRVVLKLTVEEFLARPDVVPLPGFGPCQVLACPRLRYSSKSLFCQAHLRRVRQAARSDPRL